MVKSFQLNLGGRFNDSGLDVASANLLLRFGLADRFVFLMQIQAYFQICFLSFVSALGLG
jgi:hypothetical protein